MARARGNGKLNGINIPPRREINDGGGVSETDSCHPPLAPILARTWRALTQSSGQMESDIWRTPLQASASPLVPLRHMTHSLYEFLAAAEERAGRAAEAAAVADDGDRAKEMFQELRVKTRAHGLWHAAPAAGTAFQLE